MLGDGDIQKMNVESGKEHFTNRGRYLARFVQLFTIARVRRATLAAFVVMIAQQMCGSAFISLTAPLRVFTNIVVVNIMAFYSATLFTDANASERSALLFSWGFGLINFAQVATCVPRTYQQNSLHHIALPGPRFGQSIRSGAVLCCSSHSPIWLGLY